MKLIMLSGLPASGKSTRAKEIVEQGNWVRVNRDLLREMLHFGEYSGRHEGVVVDAEKILVKSLLLDGQNVVIDDCNLNPKNKEMWSSIAKAMEASFESKFVDTDYFQCLKRDILRGDKEIGRDVITRMALQYGLYPKPAKGFVLCDLDGTLADVRHRLGFVRPEYFKGPGDFVKSWKDFFENLGGDTMRHEVLSQVVARQDDGYEIILVSARPEKYKKETEKWLSDYPQLRYKCIIMRKDNDKRPDTDIKQQIYDTYFKGKYPIHCIFDDRPVVIRMWKSNGLDVVDVGGGVEF